MLQCTLSLIVINCSHTCSYRSKHSYYVHNFMSSTIIFNKDFRTGDMAQAFRNNRQLQQFILTDVTATEKVLGTGSYGSVVEV